jgi:hypothetical protein
MMKVEMESNDILNQLQNVRQWANNKIAGGEEPPWAWFQYMKLIETLDVIIEGMNCVTTENLPQSAKRQGKHLQQRLPTPPQRTATVPLFHTGSCQR